MFCILNVTVPDAQTADKISKVLIDKRLAACVSATKEIKSTYRWQGNVESENELLLIIKTQKSFFSELKKVIKENHPYEVPEIIALPIIDVDEDYAAWMQESMD